MTNAQTLQKLRKALIQHECDGFLLPVTDEYQGEYSADYARRVTYLTGFDGSAGLVVVTASSADILVDGRYTLQAKNEVDNELYGVHDSADISVSHYLTLHYEACDKAVVAYDPWLHSVSYIESLKAKLPKHIHLRALTPNLIDVLWEEQPARPHQDVVIHDDALAGQTSDEKIAILCDKLTTDGYLITQPDALCWLLNIRGSDIPYNPLPLCYAVVGKHNRHISLIIDKRKVEAITLPNTVSIVEDEDCADFIKSLGVKTLGYDAAVTPIWFMQQAMDAGIKTQSYTNPITLLKAIKNPTELDNIRRAHEVDGVALTHFIRWFDGLNASEEVSELDVISTLESYRSQHKDYKGPSFATIAGAAEHGAIIHYRADASTNRMIHGGEALLLDSGGQYPYGTTDVTRTLHRGEASDAFRRHYSLVLKGHIALASAVFPEGTTGHQLDVLARQFLWNDGLDYKHGTGHGVGHYLCVHEGPQNIGTRANNVALQAGMVLSNEPGYYKEGAYGIRIESLMAVVPDKQEGFLTFETLTRVPIHLHLADANVLEPKEKQWLNDYNALCDANMRINGSE